VTVESTTRHFEWTFNRKVGFAFVCAGLLQWLLGGVFADPWWLIKYDLEALFPLICVMSCAAYFLGFLHLLEGLHLVTNVVLSILFTVFLFIASFVGFAIVVIWVSTIR